MGCERKFKDNYDAQNHCEPQTEYACPVCPKTFWQKDEAEEHLRQPHDFLNDPTPLEVYLEGLRFGSLPVLELQRRYINSILERQFEAKYSR